MLGLKKLEKKIVKRLKALIVLIVTSGMGLGGYASRDHPVMQKLLATIGVKISERPASPEDESFQDAEKRVLGAIVNQFDPFHKPGEFEVSIDKISLDDREFHSGREVDLEVRVVKYDAEGGRGAVVFDAKDNGRAKVAGKGPISVAWPDRPFKVEWKAGDEFDVEIWDRKGFKPTKKFVLETEDDGSFPLRSKEHTLGTDADGKTVRDPSANKIVLTAKRLSTPASSEREAPAVADRSGERRSTRR